MRKIGENIRFYRNLRSLTQTALARSVQVAPAYISQIEANQRVPSLKVTRRIATVLGIEMSVLVREADPRAQEGRLSDSEKLDLLRTLIMAIEGESRSTGDPDSATVTREGRDFVATELHSEPSYCIVLREFTSSAAFGRESDESAVECHIVLEGRVRVLNPGPGEELPVGSCRALSGAGTDRLSGMRGTRVISLYSPRVPVADLVETVDGAARAESDQA
ncbi:MAG: helix-turn-helix transcriptional regulator [Gemmatimonadetes bacterium]|nr:helix-turn-helix transcriptional regulator [Gemmatimonadota bacterium]